MRITDKIEIEGEFFHPNDEERAFVKDDSTFRKYFICILEYEIEGKDVTIKSSFRYTSQDSAWYNCNNITYNNLVLTEPMDYIYFIELLDIHGVPTLTVKNFINKALQVAQAAQVLTHYERYL